MGNGNMPTRLTKAIRSKTQQKEHQPNKHGLWPKKHGTKFVRNPPVYFWVEEKAEKEHHHS